MLKSKGSMSKWGEKFKVQNNRPMIRSDYGKVSKGVTRVHVDPLNRSKSPVKSFHDELIILPIIHPSVLLSRSS